MRSTQIAYKVHVALSMLWLEEEKPKQWKVCVCVRSASQHCTKEVDIKSFYPYIAAEKPWGRKKTQQEING